MKSQPINYATLDSCIMFETPYRDPGVIMSVEEYGWVLELEQGALLRARQDLEMGDFEGSLRIKEDTPLLLMYVRFNSDRTRVSFTMRYDYSNYEGSCQVQNFSRAFELINPAN